MNEIILDKSVIGALLVIIYLTVSCATLIFLLVGRVAFVIFGPAVTFLLLQTPARLGGAYLADDFIFFTGFLMRVLERVSYVILFTLGPYLLITENFKRKK